MIKDSSGNIDDLISILRNVTIFSGFSDSEIRKICDSCTLLEAQTGDILLQENTPATEIFVVLKGRISMVLNIHENPIDIIEFGPGNCVGEASVIGIQEHSASAVVLEDANLLVLSRTVLMKIFEEDKTLFSLLILNIARELARRLHHTDEILLHYGKLEKKSHDRSFINQHPGITSE